jgi:MFS family permease
MAQSHDYERGCTERSPLLNPEETCRDSPENVVRDGQTDERVVLQQDMSFTRLALIMGTAWVGVFLMALDTTIIATLAAPISSEFRSLNMLSWIATAYLISSAAVLPITGRLTDIFGRGPGLVVSNILFATGNLICGLASDHYTMLIGRSLAGFGGGGLRSIQNFLASDLVPLRQRGITQGIANLCYGCGAMLGGVVGGLINDNAPLGWRMAFLAQVPFSIISAVAVFLLVKVPPKQSESSYLRRIDFSGVFLSCSCTVLMLLGLNSGGNLVPWSHPLPLTTIPLAVLLFIGFIWWETKALQPIIPVKLLLDRTILSAAMTNFFTDMVIMSALFYVPLYLQVMGYSATTAGRMILPSPIGDSLGALGAGYFMRRTGKYIWLGIPSVAALVVATLFFSLQTDTSPAWYSSCGFLFLGGSYGVLLTTTQVACVAAVDQSQQAVVGSAICK